MNQKQFAKLTGLSRAFISMWLSGKRKPGYRTARALAKRFGLPIEFFAESSPDRIRVFIDRIKADGE
jgi:transcriptional regulator with XRE-family HTH domain